MASMSRALIIAALCFQFFLGAAPLGPHWLPLGGSRCAPQNIFPNFEVTFPLSRKADSPEAEELRGQR